MGAAGRRALSTAEGAGGAGVQIYSVEFNINIWGDPFGQPDELAGWGDALSSLVTEVDGVRILDEDAIARATTMQIEGTDLVIGAPMRYGLGFSLGDAVSSAARPSAFGHSGAGGSLGFADPEHRFGFGYVMNRMQVGLAEDRRPRNLVRAVYRVLERA